MRKIRYSAGMKAVVALLQELFSVVLVICIILGTALFDKSMLDLGDLQSRTFDESGYFQGLFQNSVEEIMSFIEYQEQFETDGSYNPEKAVNIMAYRNDDAVNSEDKIFLTDNDRFRYYLVDLENWSRDYRMVEHQVESSLYLTEEGVLHQEQTVYIDGSIVKESDIVVKNLRDMDISLQEKVVSDVQYYYGGYYELEDYQPPEHAEDELLEDSVQKIRNGQLFELEGQALTAVLNDLKLVNVITKNNSRVPEENYRTVGKTTILEEFLSEHITLREMQQVYRCLEYTLKNIGKEINAYKRMVNKYDKADSNLKFWIYSENQNSCYTNMEYPTAGHDFVTYGKELGSYFYYNKNEIVLNTNVDGMEDAFYEQFESRNNGKNNVVFVGVDTKFPIKDSFYKAGKEYTRLQPWVMVSIVASVISVFGCFLCFIYLSLAAGRRSEDTKVHLNWFDRIKTEFLLVGFCAYCVGIIFICKTAAALLHGSDLMGMMIMAGGLTFTLVAIFMIFYMSFVRRVKANIMWTGSLLYWIVIGIRKVIRNWKPSVKILTAFAGHVIITLLMAVVAYKWRYRGSVVMIVMAVAYLLLCGLEAVFFLRQGVQRNVIMEGIRRIAGGDLEYEIDLSLLKGDNRVMGEAVNTIGEGLYHAVDGSMKNERLKADLITNVSHDIKTPLTSIINYVDLLKREKIDNDRIRGYIGVLDSKSQRLKQLTEDLVEASKISSGNITLQMDRLNFVELVYQTAGEYNEKFEARGLTAVSRLPKLPAVILADGRRIWRVIDNLYNNVAKYAMENTRVYVDMEVLGNRVAFSIKNISKQALNINASELTERFIRGDVSRSTEGSGLGLSIAENLTVLMGGTFDIYLDGDLFKVTVTFPLVQEADGINE